MKNIVKFVTLIVCGLAAGVVNGMFGTGGGIILVFVLARLLKIKSGYNAKDAFATVIAAILPMSLVSACLYIKEGSVSIVKATDYLIPAVLGGVAGALLLEKINVKFLKKLFAVLVIYAGAKMMM